MLNFNLSKVICHKIQHSSTLTIKVVIMSIMLFAFLIQSANAANVTLAWDANADSDLVAGYKIYYGKSSGNYSTNVDAGNVTEYTVTGLDSNTKYYFVATAYDIYTIESDYSNEVSTTTGAAPTPASSSSSSGCFIATAAYGSDMAQEVIVLKKFRDDYLLKTSAGKKFVKFYYEISPPIASFIKNSKLLKTTVRIALTPIVSTIKLMFPPNDGQTGKLEIKCKN